MISLNVYDEGDFTSFNVKTPSVPRVGETAIRHDSGRSYEYEVTKVTYYWSNGPDEPSAEITVKKI